MSGPRADAVGSWKLTMPGADGSGWSGGRHELANHRVDVVIDRESEAQCPADVERAGPGAHNPRGPGIDLDADAGTHVAAREPFEAVEHLAGRHRQPWQVHRTARTERRGRDVAGVHEIPGGGVGRRDPD